MSRVAIIGGGASGLFAAIGAAENGNDVTVFEKNEKLGKKIYITGKGRCNLCNDCDVRDFFDNVINGASFLKGALYFFPPQSVKSFFEEWGLKLKTERGRRVFPQSDKASDVTKTLEKACLTYGVKFSLNSEVKGIKAENGFIKGIFLKDAFIPFDCVILCTGGISYPLTGSTGDGYFFAKSVGHSVNNLKAALVGIELSDGFLSKTSGLSLKNVQLSAFLGEKKLYSAFGEMLFTHFGISGPIVLSCSSYINKYEKEKIELFIDFKPALDYNTIDKRLVDVFGEKSNSELKTVMAEFLPKSFIVPFLSKTGISPEKKCCEITKSEREKLLRLFKKFPLCYKKPRPVEEAVVTSGGINLKEINPKTMESKLVKGLFFAGELIDADALTGGYNLNIAFSTGYCAGKNCGKTTETKEKS